MAVINKVEDWNLINAFLYVANTGSLSAAARLMGVSQPTISRQISQLEKDSGLNLFRRTSQGLEITEQGKELVDAAEAANQSIDVFQRQLSGHSESLKGDVRISVNDVVGTYLMPAAITALQNQYSDIQIELVISNQATSLSKRDADIALRMFRPTQPHLVARRLPNMALGFYAHERYLEKAGSPQKPEELLTHRIIGYDQDTSFIEGARQLGFELNQHDFVVRTDNLCVQLNLLRSGAGICGTHKKLVEHLPGIKEVLTEIRIPDLEFWLVCHSDVQYNRRISVCMEFLANWFKDNAYHGCSL